MRKGFWAVAAATLFAGALTALPAEAQPNGRAWGYYQNQDWQRAAYDNGYREGFEEGVRDARSRRRFEYDRHGAYRDGSRGYGRGSGSRDDYRRIFRQGFAAGYNDGYYGRRGSAAPRTGPNQYPQRRDPYNGSRRPGYGYGYMSEAYDRGYREGLKKGQEDGKDNDRYDPRRHKWYREGDRGYNSRYGPRDQYKAAYRDGFLRGYDEGYRERGYYGRSGGNWGGWRWPWP